MTTFREEPDGTRVWTVSADALYAAEMLDDEDAPRLTREEFDELVEALGTDDPNVPKWFCKVCERLLPFESMLDLKWETSADGSTRATWRCQGCRVGQELTGHPAQSLDLAALAAILAEGAADPATGGSA